LSGHRDNPRPPAGSRAERLEALAARLGIELPLFKGPLAAFELGDKADPKGPVYLGGDLHAVHPEATEERPGAGRDASLDSARVCLTDYENDTLEAIAVEGIWCLRLEGDLTASAPFFSLTDSEGRLRAWRLLPPPQLMIGIGHFWLPSVPAPGEPPGRGHPRRPPPPEA
jgi:hypothetical protein